MLCPFSFSVGKERGKKGGCDQRCLAAAQDRPLSTTPLTQICFGWNCFSTFLSSLLVYLSSSRSSSSVGSASLTARLDIATPAKEHTTPPTVAVHCQQCVPKQKQEGQVARREARGKQSRGPRCGSPRRGRPGGNKPGLTRSRAINCSNYRLCAVKVQLQPLL